MNEALNFPTPASQDSPATFFSPLPLGDGSVAGDSRTTTVEIPSQLCRWSIHVKTPEYTEIPDPFRERVLDPSNPDTYEPWSPSDLSKASYPDTLRDALESNDFSSIHRDKLPVAVPQVLQTSVRKEGDLLAESMAFAIMGRNLDLLRECFVESEDDISEHIDAINGFHLAAAYLDGAHKCCLILNAINDGVPLTRRRYTNSIGHTILDALMITILKSHTSCKPGSVDGTFRGAKRFPGEEIDICGRWDADSDCIRMLYSEGKHRVPSHWKHKFCHTSAQAICDAITIIWSNEYPPDINTLSGLFGRRCSYCGTNMQLTPLHTLVSVMFQLSTRGCNGEDLFGVVAVLLCLLRNGADPRLKSSVAVASFFQEASASNAGLEFNGCQHAKLDVLQFAREVFQHGHFHPAPETVVGWRVCIQILQLGQCGFEASDMEMRENQPQAQSDFEDSDLESSYSEISELRKDCLDGSRKHLKHAPMIGLLWAVVQTELATYRRLSICDSWISQNIDLKAILEGLQTNSTPDIPLIKGNMMKPSCLCGAFHKTSDLEIQCIRPDVACKFYFSNMEEWSRSRFLDIPRSLDIPRIQFGGHWILYADSIPSTPTATRTETQGTTHDNEESTSATQMSGAHQTSGTAYTSGKGKEKAADEPDQYMQDVEEEEEEEEEESYLQEDMNLPDPSFDQLHEFAWMVNPGDHQGHLDMYDDDFDMSGM